METVGGTDWSRKDSGSEIEKIQKTQDISEYSNKNINLELKSKTKAVTTCGTFKISNKKIYILWLFLWKSEYSSCYS